jgi:hypothetical protein
MPPVGFEPTISAGEQPQTYTLDQAASGTDIVLFGFVYYFWLSLICILFCLGSCDFICLVRLVRTTAGWGVSGSVVLKNSDSRGKGKNI